MKPSIIKLGFVAVAALSFFASPSTTMATLVQQGSAVAQDEGMIFNYKNAPWPGVIEWFAGQAGFVVDPAIEYPEGAFTFKSDRPLSPVESIDEINHKLRLGNPSKVLLRNGNRLFLVDANVELPAELVETISVNDLDNRGKYEPLQVKFDISGLDSESIEEQIGQRIQEHNRNFFQMYPLTNQMLVRESGENLRFIRDIIDGAKMSGTPTFSTITLNHISAELFVESVNSFYPLDENNRTEDGDLTIQIDSTPGTQQLIVLSTPKMLRALEGLVAIKDVERPTVEGAEDDPLVIRRYTVMRDTKETFDIIDRLLFDEGGGARVIQGEESGTIIVQGRKRDHGIVNEFFALLAANASGFKTVELQNGNATDIAADTQVVLGITSENLADSVKLLPNDDRDFIIVKGTPIQVTDAVQVIEELDRKAAPISDGLRVKRRVISMPPAERDRILEAFGDVWPTMGRDNPFEVRPPMQTEEDGSLFRKRDEPNDDPWDEQGSILRDRLFELAVIAAPTVAMNLTNAFVQSPDEPSPGDKLNEEESGYRLPDQIESVPGAPVRVWGTEFGIIVESDDFDAGDDAEFIIDQLLGEESEEAKPQVYQLKHVEAGYMKSLLESMYGLSSGGGGGGGGGLLGGLAENVIPGAGDMMGGLLGGGGGGSASSTLEGDVSLGTDGRLNYLWVIGATMKDLANIDSAIAMFDVSTAPQNPETAGQLFAIVIKHRDPEEVKMQVETFMEQYFQDAEAAKQGGGGNDAANMMKAMRQAMTGNNGGGGGDAEEKKPRGSLSVDPKTSKLFFLGPKSIFRQVEFYVSAIDVPEVQTPRKIFEMSVDNPERVAGMIRDMLGKDKVEIEGMDGDSAEGSEGGTEGGKAQNPQGNKAAETQMKQAEAARNSMIQQMIQARGAAGGRGGGGRQGGGAGRGGGGGGRGGGGRGGR